MEMIPKSIAQAIATAFKTVEDDEGPQKDKVEFKHVYKGVTTVYTLVIRPKGRVTMYADLLIDIIERYDRYRLLEMRGIKTLDVIECTEQPSDSRGCAMPDPPKPVGHVAIQSENIDICIRMAEYRCS